MTPCMRLGVSPLGVLLVFPLLALPRLPPPTFLYTVEVANHLVDTPVAAHCGEPDTTYEHLSLL